MTTENMSKIEVLGLRNFNKNWSKVGLTEGDI